jgi:hypothetical protein
LIGASLRWSWLAMGCFRTAELIRPTNARAAISAAFGVSGRVEGSVVRQSTLLSWNQILLPSSETVKVMSSSGVRPAKTVPRRSRTAAMAVPSYVGYIRILSATGGFPQSVSFVEGLPLFKPGFAFWPPQ